MHRPPSFWFANQNFALRPRSPIYHREKREGVRCGDVGSVWSHSLRFYLFRLGPREATIDPRRRRSRRRRHLPSPLSLGISVTSPRSTYLPTYTNLIDTRPVSSRFDSPLSLSLWETATRTSHRLGPGLPRDLLRLSRDLIARSRSEAYSEFPLLTFRLERGCVIIEHNRMLRIIPLKSSFLSSSSSFSSSFFFLIFLDRRCRFVYPDRFSSSHFLATASFIGRRAVVEGEFFPPPS